MATFDDSRDSSTQAAELLKEFYQDEHARQKRPDPAARSTSPAPLLAVLALPLCLGLTAWNVLGAQSNESAFSAAQSEDAGRFALYVVARQIDHFRHEHGRLPDSLAEVDPSEDRVRYKPNAEGFVLTVETQDGILVYKDGEDLDPFAEAAKGRLRGIG